MGAALTGLVIGFTLVAGSTQIELAWLSVTQLILGTYVTVIAAIAGWQASRD